MQAKRDPATVILQESANVVMPSKLPETTGLPDRVWRELVEKDSRWKFASTVQRLVKVRRIHSFQPSDVLNVFQPLYASLLVAGHACDLSDPTKAIGADLSIVLLYSSARSEPRSCLGSASLTHPARPPKSK